MFQMTKKWTTTDFGMCPKIDPYLFELIVWQIILQLQKPDLHKPFEVLIRENIHVRLKSKLYLVKIKLFRTK